VTDTATFVFGTQQTLWLFIDVGDVYLCILFILHCIKNWFKILSVKPIIDGSYFRWQQVIALLVTVIRWSGRLVISRRLN
jgi:hypothetical protein